MAFFGSFLILCVARFFESPKIEIRLFSEEFFVFLLLSVVLIGLLLVIQLVGISSLNTCPSVLNNYYKKPCLLALSLYGNNLRKGYSLIIFLLNEELNKVNSIEKISLGDLVLRHFVTDEQNRLFEDKKGNIYISADKKGIYRVGFKNFR